MMISSPQPSVIHLVTLFRQISAGDIRIPAFQREFVWKQKQMIELLDSVLEGYPIGSILLWWVNTRMLKIAPEETTSFPNVEEHFPTNYVLDGMQRLSTLYGVFHFGSTTKDPRFDIAYDLTNMRFIHKDDFDSANLSYVPLAALFTPRQLLECQGRIAQLKSGDLLTDRLLALQAAFQEYMIPVVTIKSDDINRIVGIFEKINSTGTKLDPVDFMRAITWAEDFDLNHYLESSISRLEEIEFPIASETLIKCVGLVLGIPPTTEDLLRLRSCHARDLREAFERAILALGRVATFVDENFSIKSSSLIPYEGQLLVLFKAIGMEQPDAEEQNLIVRWFWAVGFNESLRGKPDHYVVRAVSDWRALVRGEIRGLEPRLRLTAEELYERRLVASRALSTTVATMYAIQGARDICDGELIPSASYMTSSDLSAFDVIFSRSELIKNGFSELPSARMFGNTLLTDPRKENERQPACLRNLLLAAGDQESWELLSTQFLDRQALEYLRSEKVSDFMRSRAQIMHKRAQKLVDTGT